MVARLGAAIIDELQRHGVAACGKHFPGHGDTSVDSHLELPLVEHPPDRIRRVECLPFVSAIKAGVAFIMTAHVLVPSLDESRPATLSPRVVQGMLREELGFEGVILSDDLEMKAVAATYSVPDAAVQAIAAGCDGLLICSGNVEVQAVTLEALVHAVEKSGSRSNVEDALAAARGQGHAAGADHAGRAVLRAGAGRPPPGARLRRAPPRGRRHGPRRVMVRPAALHPGDRIAVVAPASGCAPEELERGEAELRRLGFDPVHTEAVFERSTFSAGSPDAPRISCAWADRQ